MMRIECVRRLRAMVAIATDNPTTGKRIQIESRPFSSRAFQTLVNTIHTPDYGHFANPQQTTHNSNVIEMHRMGMGQMEKGINDNSTETPSRSIRM